MRTTERRAKDRARRRIAAVVSMLAILLLGCGDGAPPSATELDIETPADGFAALEATLRSGGPGVRIAFDVTAEGAATADLTGVLMLDRRGRARLEATGEFGGQPLNVTLISDGDRMFWTGADGGIDTPLALRDALALGFTRMGILHNLARLSGAAAPDHADGGVEEWVMVAPRDSAAAEWMDAADSSSVLLDITVAGQPSGFFALELDGRVPVVRRQEVRFPQGIMRVTERYRGVDFGADFAESAFDTTPLDPTR